MRLLIGGSPSTGSSVFRQILNRHPKVYCGPETNLFCYRELYQNWKLARRRLFLPSIFGLQKADVRLIRGVHLEDKEIGWTRNELKQLISASNTFPAFCDAFFAKTMERQSKSYWSEKTPANVLQFPMFMKAFEEAFIIHIVRSPYDTVASLMSRGMHAYQSAATYLLYTAHGLAARNMPGYIELKYEFMVRDPAQTLDTQLLQVLGLQFVPGMLEPGNADMAGVTQMPGWRSDELSSLSHKSLSRYNDEPQENQALIALALASVRIKSQYVKRHQLQHDSIEKVCADVHYPYLSHSINATSAMMQTLKAESSAVDFRLSFARLLTSSVNPIELIQK